jgi:hypothetical protein
MSETTVESIANQLTEIQEAYQRDYAGKDRHLCDPGGLESFISTLKKITAELDSLGALTAGEGSASLRAQLDSQVQAFERERNLILSAKEMGEGFEKFAIEGAAANFVFERYNRNFAGQSRDTRDLGLIKELLEELRGIKKRMTAIGGKKLPQQMSNDIELVQQNIERYSAEEREIPKAQASGEPDQQADRLAFLANHQFSLYQTFFAGQSRLTRRPALLVRLTENLKRYRTAMFNLKSQGHKSESNDGNITVIDGRVKAYEAELGEIRKVRSGVKLADIMSNLGGAANDVFQKYRDEYAGKDRATVDLAQLGTMIDKLDEIRRQMEELGRVEKNDMNIQNAKVVREYQASWIQEYAAIRTAQAASAT